MDKIKYTPELKNGELGVDANSVLNRIVWEQTTIDMKRWNLYYPYRLFILEDRGGGTYDSVWEFILPIPPQELTINMPIATSVQATLGGIVEYHNAAPFRDITIQGTTGFTPIKNSSDPSSGLVSGANKNLLFVLGGSLLGGAVADVKTILNNPFIIGKNVNKDITDSETDNDNIPGRSTGYYQFRLLQRFLETYLELKKTDIQIDSVSSKDLRLAFASPKDQAIYLCSGVGFTMKRSAASPMEYTYTLNLKAWKRISAIRAGGDSLNQAIAIPNARSPNLVTSFLNILNNINTISNALSDVLITASNGLDFIVGDVLRQVTGVTKNFMNLPLTVRDMPSKLATDILTSVLNDIDEVKKLAQQYDIPQPPDPIKPRSLWGDNGPLAPNSGHSSKPPLADANPSGFKLPNSIKQKILEYRDSLNQTTRAEYEQMRDQIKQIDATISSLNKPLDDDQIVTLFSLNALAQILDYMAMSRNVEAPKYTSVEYIAGLAERSGIAFKTPISKFAIPFPYNHTLEQVAGMYLGDTERWHEIAALNGLRAPYVDEVGFKLPFLTNGDGRKCYVSDKSNLFINQTVWISALTKLNSKRKIVNIREIYEGFIEVELDGDANLDTYTVAASSTLQAFLPGTVNSQQLLYIPSSIPARQDPKLAKIPSLDEMDPMLAIGGIDLLLTSDGDLAITPDGDCKLAMGMANVIQRIKLALSTRQGELPQHLSYGLSVDIGDSVADLDIKGLSSAIISMFENDTTFKRVASLDINQKGPNMTINMVLELNGVSQTLPVSFGLSL